MEQYKNAYSANFVLTVSPKINSSNKIYLHEM